MSTQITSEGLAHLHSVYKDIHPAYTGSHYGAAGFKARAVKVIGSGDTDD